MGLIEELKIKNEYEEKLTEYTKILISRTDKSRLEELSELRGYSIDTIKKLDIFYIESQAEMMIPKYLKNLREFGVISNVNHKPIFENRWVIPIKNNGGKVMNLVGYSPKADERYIFGSSTYYSRGNTLYGLENMNEAIKKGYAIITEGITDTIKLRDLGIDNSFATCGTSKSDSIMTQLNRLRYGVIFVPDRDWAGEQTKKHWITNRFIRLKISFKFKDLDEMLKEQEYVELFKSYYEECVKYLKEKEHLGYKHEPKEITII